MTWYIVAAVLGVLIAVNYRYSRRRTRSLAILHERAETNLEEEWAALANRHSFEVDDVRRLWSALARAYRIPAEKMRADDQLQGELAGLFRHPDFDPLLSSLFLSNRKVVERYLPPKLATWGGLIAAIRRVEVEAGGLATAPGPDDEFIWAD